MPGNACRAQGVAAKVFCSPQSPRIFGWPLYPRGPFSTGWTRFRRLPFDPIGLYPTTATRIVQIFDLMTSHYIALYPNWPVHAFCRLQVAFPIFCRPDSRACRSGGAKEVQTKT